MNPYYSFLHRFLINIESLNTCPPNLHFVPHTLFSKGAEKYDDRVKKSRELSDNQDSDSKNAQNKELEELVFEIEELSGVKNVLSIFTLTDIDQKAWLGDFYNPDFYWNEDTILKKLQHIQTDPSIRNRI